MENGSACGQHVTPKVPRHRDTEFIYFLLILRIQIKVFFIEFDDAVKVVPELSRNQNYSLEITLYYISYYQMPKMLNFE